MTRHCVHIAECFGGGTFEVIRQLANDQAEQGWQVSILHGRRDETPSEAALASLFDARILRHELLFASNMPLRSLLALIRALRSLKPDVIHLHSSKAGFLGRLAARYLNLQSRVLYTPHGWSFIRQDTSAAAIAIFQGLEWVGARLGGTIVACSSDEAALAHSRLGAKRIKILRNGIALPSIKTGERGTGRFRVTTTGRLTAQKAPWRMAELAARPELQGVEFVWIGSGSEDDQNRWLANRRVRFTGRVERDVVAKLLAQSNVFLMLSAWEGLPLALIEAQSMGIPAIVSDIPGCREIVVHGETGFVVKDNEEAAQRIQQLLEDTTLQRKLGQQAADRARLLFSTEAFLQESRKLYQEVMAASYILKN